MHFSEDEKSKIKKAVQQLEQQTAGEVVPYFVKQSDSYHEASWLLALLFGLFPTLMLLAISVLEFPVDPVIILVVGSGFTAIGWFTPRFIPLVLRMAISPNTFDFRVSQRAQQAFLAEEVFNTTDRIGVLIFISELERKVIVLADKGINAKVTPDAWKALVNQIVKGIKEGQKGDGIVAAIKECETILLANGFTNRIKEANELSDELREG